MFGYVQYTSIILPPHDMTFPSTTPVTACSSRSSGYLGMEQLDSGVKEGSSSAILPMYITSKEIAFSMYKEIAFLYNAYLFIIMI